MIGKHTIYEMEKKINDDYESKEKTNNLREERG